MRYDFWMTFDNDFLAQLKDPGAFVALKARQDSINQIKKSLRVFFDRGIASNQHADNFVMNRTTFLLSGKAYRIPRIIKHSLLKKLEIK